MKKVTADTEIEIEFKNGRTSFIVRGVKTQTEQKVLQAIVESLNPQNLSSKNPSSPIILTHP